FILNRSEQGCEPQRLNIDHSVVLPDYKVIVNKLKQLRAILFCKAVSVRQLVQPSLTKFTNILLSF
ncbi:MAG: hypothetical protein ACRDC6_29250, partial [Shewanella sp.]